MRLDGVLTPTRVELGHRCYRRHAISDILEKNLYKAASAAFGNVIHAGAAAHWRGSGIDQVLDAVRQEYLKNANDLNEKHSFELAESMIKHYIENARISGPFIGNYQVVTIEERISTVINGYKISMQLDRALSLDNRRMLIVDTKTAARLDQRWRNGWDMSLQMKLYKLITQTLFDMPVDIVVEGLLKAPKSKIEYYATPDWDFDQLDEAKNQFLAIASADDEVLSSARINFDTEFDLGRLTEVIVNQTRYNPGDCNSYNVQCPFYRVCSSPPSQRVGLLNAEYIDVPGDY